MKKGKNIAFLTLALILSIPMTSYATICREDQKLVLIGSVSSDGQLIGSSAQVRLLVVVATTTATLVGFYDVADENGIGTTTSEADVVIEIPAAASVGALVPQSGFFEQPIDFEKGIYVAGNNIAFVGAYHCTDRN